MQYLSAHPHKLPRAPESPPIQPEHRTLSVAAIWKWLNKDPLVEFLADTATYGAWLPLDPAQTWPRGTYPNRVPQEHRAEINQQLMVERELGWIKEGEESGWANAPIQTSVEPSKIRRIVDYSNRSGDEYAGFNGITDKTRLPPPTMATAHLLAEAVFAMEREGGGQHPLLLVRDVSKAYRRFVVRPHQWPTLKMLWGGEILYDTRLPFGHAASAAYCCAMTTAIARQLSAKLRGKAIVLAYVDDFVVVARRGYTTEAEEMLENCLKEIGLPISEAKSNESGGWATIATWIGFAHDTAAKTHSLTGEKLKKIYANMDAAERQPQDIARWQRLVGALSHVAQVFHAAKPQLRPLHEHISKIRREFRAPAPRATLRWWRKALLAMRGAARMARRPRKNGPTIVTDASLFGGGWALYTHRTPALNATSGDHLRATMAFPFAERHAPGDMTLLEAHAVLRAIRVCGKKLQNQSVWIAVDNAPLEYALRKGRSRAPRVNAVVAEILLCALRHKIRLYPLRIPSAQNTLADQLSRMTRGQEPPRIQRLRAEGKFRWGQPQRAPSNTSLPKWVNF